MSFFYYIYNLILHEYSYEVKRKCNKYKYHGKHTFILALILIKIINEIINFSTP